MERARRVLILGAEGCPACSLAKEYAEELALDEGVEVRYVDLGEDSPERRRLVEEALRRGLDAVPLIFVEDEGGGLELKLRGVPRRYEDFKRLVLGG